MKFYTFSQYFLTAKFYQKKNLQELLIEVCGKAQQKFAIAADFSGHFFWEGGDCNECIGAVLMLCRTIPQAPYQGF